MLPKGHTVGHSRWSTLKMVQRTIFQLYDGEKQCSFSEDHAFLNFGLFLG